MKPRFGLTLVLLLTACGETATPVAVDASSNDGPMGHIDVVTADLSDGLADLAADDAAELEPEPTSSEPEPEPFFALPQSGLTVDIEAGQVQGATEGGLRVFKGIPYAEAPLGSRRFAPPVKKEAWAGTRPATTFGPSCPQIDLGELALGDGGFSEDCLSLNVWAHDDGQSRPVMVFIYGGAFIIGSTARCRPSSSSSGR